jgi:hypothetical protein
MRYLLLLLFPAIAHAQTIRVSLVVATGKHSVTCEQGRYMFREVQNLYKPLGVNLSLRWFRCLPNPRRRRDRITGYGVDNTHWYWDEDYFIGRRYKGGKVIHHAIIPPVWYDNAYWMAGQSYQGCWGRKISISHAMITNALGEPRLKHSITAMAHEMAHSLNADHDNTKPVTIMHEAPLPYVANTLGYLAWSELSKSQVKECVNRLTARGQKRQNK